MKLEREREEIDKKAKEEQQDAIMKLVEENPEASLIMSSYF